MLDVPKIRSILANAAFLDLEFPISGSECHTHLLRPPLSMEELDAWESLMQVSLPADYRTYLTKLGNGGAGPSYGLTPFHSPMEEALQKPTVFSDDAQPQFDQLARQWYVYMHEDEYELYEDYCRNTAEKDRLSFNDWDNRRYDFIDRTVKQFLFENGQLFIANQGCSNDVYLLLNGSHRGMCNCNSTEYDYSYPFWYQKADHHSAIIWPQYRDTLVTFEDYFMHYVDQAEQLCASIPFEKKLRFYRERMQVLEFQDAIEEEDWDRVLSMLIELAPAELPTKIRRFYRYHQRMLETQFPERPEVTNFFREMDRTYRYRCSESSYIQGNAGFSTMYPYPSFEDFMQSISQLGSEMKIP